MAAESQIHPLAVQDCLDPEHPRRAALPGGTRVCEVKYDHLQGDRFRHAAVFLRWRDDKRPADCRYDQLEVTPPAELADALRRAAA